MSRRSKISSGRSKKLFSRTASRSHKKNNNSGKVMRGGIRL